MSNLFDYLDWRGDLSFAASPFCEIDNLILSMSSFVDFADATLTAPPVPFHIGMRKFDLKTRGKDYLGAIIPADILNIARRASKTDRFKNCGVINHVKIIDEQRPMQFGAVSFILPDESIFVAFEGTDDTIAGWKEDMYMSINAPVPAQEMATAYLEQTAMRFDGSIRVGGHSKGGNLAVWAAVHCKKELRDRIIAVYNNDGPGFLPKIFQSEGYAQISERLHTFIPQSSVVGTLLEQDSGYHIIKSTETGIMQHNPLSWEVAATRFVYLRERSKFGKQSDVRMRRLLDRMSEQQRRDFTSTLFTVIDSTGAKTLTELNESKMRNIITIIHSLKALSGQERALFVNVLQRLIGTRRMTT